MDDIGDEFFANLSQATIDAIISDAKSVSKEESSTTTNVRMENEKDSGKSRPGEDKEEKEQKTSVLRGEGQEVISMEVCQVVQEVFGSLPMVELVCSLDFEN